jgi:hypothetical protein
MTKKLFPAYVESFSFSQVSVKVPSDEVFCHSPINQFAFSIALNSLDLVSIVFELLHEKKMLVIARDMKELLNN